MLPHPLLLLASCLVPLAAAGRYCQPGDSCWPSPAQVEELAASCNISYRHSEHSYYSESEYSPDGDSWRQRSVNPG